MSSRFHTAESDVDKDGDLWAALQRTCLYQLPNRLLRLWASWQVSYHGGKYSIERVLALDEYTRTTSIFRVLVVCIGTPLPMMAIVFLQELFPLQNPADGWKANFGFWFRVAMLTLVTAHTFLIQGTFMVQGFTLSWRRLALFMICLAIIHTGASIIVGANLAFPIPFFYVTMTPSFYVPLFTLLFVLLRKKRGLSKYLCFIATQKAMGMIYPAYQLLFHNAANTNYVLPVVVLLPVIKIVVKNIVLRFTKHLEDMTPEAVIFTVDFYNALYLSTCMESASTLKTMLIMIVTDATQTVIMLFGTHQRTRTILQRLIQATEASCHENVLAAVCDLCRTPGKIETQIKDGIRVRSSLQHRLFPADKPLLVALDSLFSDVKVRPPVPHFLTKMKSSISTSSRSFPSPKKPSFLCLKRVAAVHPILARRRVSRSDSVEMKSPRDSKTASIYLSQHQGILQEALRALYTLECLVLTGYLEAIIPLLYVNYMMVMVHLPSAKYHTELKNVTRQNVEYTGQVISLFGVLQLLSFLLLALLIRRNCGMRVLYQLAFVLETQMVLVQGKLMIWMLVTLACRVVHFGVDYSFKFAWMN